jgi:hypothetical protein
VTRLLVRVAALVHVAAFPKNPAPPKVFTVTLESFLKAA